MATLKFENDDDGYFQWLTAHPSGYVLNVRADPDPEYVVLHRAGCGQISTTKRADGAYTAKNYRKWCGDSIDELRSAARTEGRKNGSFSKYCKLCQP